MNILFVCKWNRFRSRVAEAYFKKTNKDKSIKVKSAGVFQGSYTNKDQIAGAKEFGLDIAGKPWSITSKLLQWQDITIIVADDVPQSLFDTKYKKELIEWKIPDADIGEKEKVRETVKLIMANVDNLIVKLQKEKNDRNSKRIS